MSEEDIYHSIEELWETLKAYYNKDIEDIFISYFGEDNVEIVVVDDLIGNSSNCNFKVFFCRLYREYVLDGDQCTTICVSGTDDMLTLITEGKTQFENLFTNPLDYAHIASLMFNIYSGYGVHIHFPEIVVTNERKKSTVIQDVFVKIPLTVSGGLICDARVIFMNKSHYTYAHFLNRYIHSHCPRVSYTPEGLREYHSTCTGDGPINITRNNLVKFDEDLWVTFCWDLSKYVTIESEAGGPYIYLSRANIPFRIYEKIELDGSVNPYGILSTSELSIPEIDWIDFMKYAIAQKKLKFVWSARRGWVIGDTGVETMLTMSNLFLEWYKSQIQEYELSIDDLFYQNVLLHAVAVNDSLYHRSEENLENMEELIGQEITYFKGVPYYLVIDEKDTSTTYAQTILNPNIVKAIIYFLVMILNCCYER